MWRAVMVWLGEDRAKMKFQLKKWKFYNKNIEWTNSCQSVQLLNRINVCGISEHTVEELKNQNEQYESCFVKQAPQLQWLHE